MLFAGAKRISLSHTNDDGHCLLLADHLLASLDLQSSATCARTIDKRHAYALTSQAGHGAILHIKACLCLVSMVTFEMICLLTSHR